MLTNISFNANTYRFIDQLLVYQNPNWQLLAGQQGLPKQTAPVLTQIMPGLHLRPHSAAPQEVGRGVGGDGTEGSWGSSSLGLGLGVLNRMGGFVLHW